MNHILGAYNEMEDADVIYYEQPESETGFIRKPYSLDHIPPLAAPMVNHCFQKCLPYYLVLDGTSSSQIVISDLLKLFARIQEDGGYIPSEFAEVFQHIVTYRTMNAAITDDQQSFQLYSFIAQEMFRCMDIPEGGFDEDDTCFFSCGHEALSSLSERMVPLEEIIDELKTRESEEDDDELINQILGDNRI